MSARVTQFAAGLLAAVVLVAFYGCQHDKTIVMTTEAGPTTAVQPGGDVGLPADANLPPADSSSAIQATDTALPAIWQTNLSAALEQAKAQNKPLLVDFTSPACGWCVRLEQDVLSNPRFINVVRDKYILAHINMADQANAAAIAPYRNRITGTPTLMILRSDGSVAAMQAGYMPLDRAIDWVTQSMP